MSLSCSLIVGFELGREGREGPEQAEQALSSLTTRLQRCPGPGEPVTAAGCCRRPSPGSTWSQTPPGGLGRPPQPSPGLCPDPDTDPVPGARPSTPPLPTGPAGLRGVSTTGCPASPASEETSPCTVCPPPWTAPSSAGCWWRQTGSGCGGARR